MASSFDFNAAVADCRRTLTYGLKTIAAHTDGNFACICFRKGHLSSVLSCVYDLQDSETSVGNEHNPHSAINRVCLTVSHYETIEISALGHY